MRTWLHRHPNCALIICALLASWSAWSWVDDGYWSMPALFSGGAMLWWTAWALYWWERT